MKVLSYIISLIFLWSTGAMAFAPGFLQVAGGGGAVASGYCASNPGYVVCDDFTDGNIDGWTNVGSGSIAYDNSTGSGAIKLTSGLEDARLSGTISTERSYNWEVKIYLPCSSGYDDNLRVAWATYATFIETMPTCGSWTNYSGTAYLYVGTDFVRLLDRGATAGKIIMVKDVRVW